MKKWNLEKRQYEPYIPPPGYVTLYEGDMDQRCNCASCGKEITFGSGYTSLQIHNDFGLGYAVCESCYATELQEELMYPGVPYMERFGESSNDPL